MTPAMENCVLLKFGELSLKGRNRWRFTDQLRKNAARAMRDLGPVELRQGAGVLTIAGPVDRDELVERARTILGISLLHPAVSIEKSPEAAAETAVELLRGRPGRTFAVRARRRDKRFPLNSQELATLVGARVQADLGLDVDLSTPHLEIHLEVDRDEIFAYTEKIPGPGGLPVGISGRALVLLSGGIDSPVAAYRMMKRGLRCDFIHFSGRPYTGAESIYKAYALAANVDRFQSDSRLFVVPFGAAQRQLATAGAGELQVLAQRRLMVHTATALARREGLEALVTGDSLGQVSSQTLPNLTVVENATDLPLLRPLIDRDKAEIVEDARRLGTLEISNMPDEDCCTLFASRVARTRAQVRELIQVERRLELDEIVAALVDGAELVHPGRAEPVPV